MHWIAPSEKDTATDTLEKRLWAAADQFRANSGLSAAQYSQPVLGLIFLRFAEVRFARQRAQLESPSPLGGERAGVRAESYSGEPTRELSIHGVAKTDETGCLCRMVAARKDLAVHGLEGGQVNSYYFDPHDDTNRFNFVGAICLVSPSVPNETSVRSPRWAGR